ncbi:MAG TPA: sigma-70 family RNA polymerase sigma factor, partial [Pilimelia sp.]|nr:sigma-70 family RNA polymerase sigma factor [Pilimelia sp.]
MPTGVQPHNEPPSGEPEQPADAETARLWPLLCAGDPVAVAQLYQDHFAAIVRHLRKKLPSWVDPDDLAQEAFLRAIRQFHADSTRPRKLRRWLYGIARHVLAAHYEKARPSRDVQGQTVVVDLPSLEAMTEAGVPVAAFGVAEPGFDSHDQRTAVADAADVVNSLSSPLLRKLMQTHLRLLVTTGEEVTGQPLAEQADCTPQEAYRWTNRGKDKIVHWMALLAVARSSAACPRAAEIVPPPSAAGSRPRRLRFTDLSREQLRDLERHVLRDDDPRCPHCPEVYQDARHVSAHALGWGVLFTVAGEDREAHPAVVDVHAAARGADAAAATPASGAPALAGVSTLAEAVPTRLSALAARANQVLSEAWATMAARVPLLTNVASAAPGHAAVVRGAAGILGVVLLTAATVGAPEPGHRRPPAVAAAPPVGNQGSPVPAPPDGPDPTAEPGQPVRPSTGTTGPGGAGGLVPEATVRPALTPTPDPTTGPVKATAFPCAGLALTSAMGPASASRPAAVSSG